MPSYTGLFIAVLASMACALPATAAEITLTSLLAEMVDRDRIARVPAPSYTTGQASSYDRTTTPDRTKASWFANHDWDQCLRAVTLNGRQEFVILDAAGPGAITRIWKGGDDRTNRLRIYLDDATTPVIDEVADAWLGGSLWVHPPFAAVRARGLNTYLPIPYATHCLMTLDKLHKDWYNIEYRTYPAQTAVKSFTKADFDASTALLQRIGQQLVGTGEGLAAGATTRPATTKHLATGQTLTTTITGPAAIRQLTASVGGTNRDQALRSTVLSIACDDEQTVWCPVGDFFASGIGLNPYHDWYKSVERSGTLRCWWVMPFAKSCTVTLTNLGQDPVEATLGGIDVGPWTWDRQSMYFHSTWRQQYPLRTVGRKGTCDWDYVHVTGQGVYLGDMLAIRNGAKEWWGEGDEKITIDHEPFPSHFGTGTEDHYGYAWGCPSFFEAPFHAQPCGHGNNSPGYTTNTRTRCLDAIPFTTSLDFDMEVWHWGATDMLYAATTYWYALPGATCNRVPMPEEAVRPIPPAASP